MLSTWQWSRVTSDVCGTVLVGNDSVDVSEGEDGMSTNAESNMRPSTRITGRVFFKKIKKFYFSKKKTKKFFFAKTKVLFFFEIFFQKKGCCKREVVKNFFGLLFSKSFFFNVFFGWCFVFLWFFVCFF